MAPGWGVDEVLLEGENQEERKDKRVSYRMDKDHGARQVSTRMLQEAHGKALPSSDKFKWAVEGDGSPRSR